MHGQQRLTEWREEREERNLARRSAQRELSRAQWFAWIAAVYFATVALWGFLDLRLSAQTGLEYIEQYIDKMRLAVYARRHEPLARQAQKQVVLVAISDDTFRELSLSGAPVPRAYHAKIIRDLTRAGAKVIAFDLIFDLDRPGDEEMAAAARESGKVLWAGADLFSNEEEKDETSRQQLIPPNARLRSANPHWAHIHLTQDSERPAIDRIQAVMEDNGQLVPAFSLKAVAMALGHGDKPLRRTATGWRIGDLTVPVDELGNFKISYLGQPAQTFPIFPYELLYNGEADADFYRKFFRDKLVFIGDTTKVGKDSYYTPVGNMRGVEIHAHAAATLLQRSLVREAAPLVNLAVLCVLVGMAVLLTIAWRLQVAALAAAALLTGYFVVNIWLFVDHALSLHFVAPAAATLMATLGVLTERAVSEERQKRRARVLMEEARAAEHAAEEARQSAEIAQQVADAANQAKSAFLANMSHELRTPLNAIIGYSEMLQEEVEDLGVPELAPDLHRIHIAGKHLLSLINDVLDFSKIEAGKMELYLETFPIATTIEDVASIVQPLIAKNGNTLKIVVADDIGSMHADLTKVKQGLFNLLSNASKFTEKGTITLAVSRATVEGREWIGFRVTDTGIGMTPEQLGRMFQAFSQADASTTRKFGGTGLGLAITRRFCQMMGGDVTVESEFGQGTTFTMRLPAQVVDPDAAVASNGAAASSAAAATQE